MNKQYLFPTKPYSKADIHAFWSKVVADQINSKMSMVNFCKQHQLKFTSLRYWKYTSKIGRATCKNANNANPKDSLQETKLIPLQIASMPSTAHPGSKINNEGLEIKLVFNNGHKLILPFLPLVISKENLSMIIKTVAEIPC